MSVEIHSDGNGELPSEGPIATLFSGAARTQIIEAFVSNGDRELTISDVARLSDTARSSVYRHIEDLQKLGIVEAVETPTGANRYKLDQSDDLALTLRELEGAALKRLLEIEE